MQDERRKYLRFDAALDGTFHVQDSDIEGMLMLSNVSNDGFKATLNKEVTPGNVLECEMRLPESIMPFFVTGRVVWSRENEVDLSSGFDAGIQLELIDFFERQRILDYAYAAANISTEDEDELADIQP
ncbi:MAG: PilZ domain-containing protein [Candidatus Omnitrophota bacterium]